MRWCVFTDSRFRPLFKNLYRWNKVLGYYQLGWDLAVETTTVATYPARSRLECVVVCQSCGNCTAVDYGMGEQLCHCVTHVFAILPWCLVWFIQPIQGEILPPVWHKTNVLYDKFTPWHTSLLSHLIVKHMQSCIGRLITKVESVRLFN